MIHDTASCVIGLYCSQSGHVKCWVSIACLLQVVNPDAKRLLVQNAAQAYEKALGGLPDEWMYACYYGKLHAKLGEQSAFALHNSPN